MHVLLIKILKHLLNCTKKSFDIIAISETRITKQVSLSNNLNLLLLIIFLNLLLVRLLQVVTFFTLLIIYHINVAVILISIKKN